VTSELLSGPDLGAGYLHQLSLDREGEVTAFTFHAQAGGLDAAGPPKGPLDVFGFVHPPSPCPFGGPRCWHRRFQLPVSEAPHARQAYNRNRFVLQTMLDQVYDRAPAGVETALEEVVQRISGPLAQERTDWYVGGSAAAWLLGAGVVPADVDLGTTRAGVGRVAALLAEYLIEPFAPTEWPTAGMVQGARAFVGTFQTGARVEWAVPLEARTPEAFEEWSGRADVVRLTTASVHGHEVRVTRPEYALVRAQEKHRPNDVAAIVEVVWRLGPDRELLGALLARSRLTEPERATIRQQFLGERST